MRGESGGNAAEEWAMERWRTKNRENRMRVERNGEENGPTEELRTQAI